MIDNNDFSSRDASVKIDEEIEPDYNIIHQRIQKID
jgi:hypothetical protein